MYKPQARGFGDYLNKALLLVLSTTIPAANQVPILGSSPMWLNRCPPYLNDTQVWFAQNPKPLTHSLLGIPSFRGSAQTKT